LGNAATGLSMRESRVCLLETTVTYRVGCRARPASGQSCSAAAPSPSCAIRIILNPKRRPCCTTSFLCEMAVSSGPFCNTSTRSARVQTATGEQSLAARVRWLTTVRNPRHGYHYFTQYSRRSTIIKIRGLKRDFSALWQFVHWPPGFRDRYIVMPFT